MSEERLRNAIDDLLKIVKVANVYIESNIVGRGRVTGDDMHSYVNAVWAAIQHIAKIPCNDPYKKDMIGSVERAIMSRREQLRPANQYLSPEREVDDEAHQSARDPIGEREVSDAWYRANRDQITEFFFAAERITKVFDRKYMTRRYDRNEIRQLVATGRHKRL